MSNKQDSGLFISFNQDFSCLSVGSNNGYQIYNCDPFGRCFSRYTEDLGIGIVEMLFSTSLVAIVGTGERMNSSQRRLLIANTKRNSTICELSFASSVLAIKINRKNIVVVLEEFIYIYDIGNMHLLETIDTCPNPNALCSLSPSPDKCYLAYPTGTTLSGELVVYDVNQMQKVCIITAHKNALSCIQFNYSGELIATASDKGTIIRVYKSNNADLLYQFRRGTYSAHIYSLSFDLTNTFLGVSSDSDTIHIFRLGENKNNNSDESNVKTSLINGVKNKVSSLLIPDAVNTIFEPQRDFAFAKLPIQSKGIKNICAISKNSQVMVAVENGKFYHYNLDTEQGGECILSREYSFIDP
ncbi:WD40 repeat-like protein [Neocallimastix californiae]|uniref:WD40 repeat-like protein n=1 Tax=Neocallimastix californiae TaxID=1754190 RepID=A0A1Y2DAN2_9FUNG|nr:WD40 repeat-like protein [Neocallimastix californiae]|eukprot:ORY56214.1 WD40 repeat-like protein [Neocallimastix californiae]